VLNKAPSEASIEEVLLFQVAEHHQNLRSVHPVALMFALAPQPAERHLPDLERRHAAIRRGLHHLRERTTDASHIVEGWHGDLHIGGSVLSAR